MGAKDKMKYIEDELSDGGGAIPFSASSLLLPDEQVEYETRRHWATVIPYLLIALAFSRMTSALSLFLIMLPFFQVKTYEYIVTDMRIIAREGLFRQKTLEIPVEDVTDVSFKSAGIAEKIGIGEVIVNTADANIAFKFVEDPKALAYYIGKIAASRSAEKL